MSKKYRGDRCDEGKFQQFTDTGQQTQERHDMNEIIAMNIAAEIGNCDRWNKIGDFCQRSVAARTYGAEIGTWDPVGDNICMGLGTNRSESIQAMLMVCAMPACPESRICANRAS